MFANFYINSRIKKFKHKICGDVSVPHATNKKCKILGKYFIHKITRNILSYIFSSNLSLEWFLRFHLGLTNITVSQFFRFTPYLDFF